MGIKEFLNDLQRLNYFLVVENGRLVLKGDKDLRAEGNIPATRPAASIIDYIQRNKEEIIRFIAASDQEQVKPGFEDVSAMYRLSPMQEAILFQSLYDQQTDIYLNQLVCEITIPDLQAFMESWNILLRDHTILRTAFYADAFKIPVQGVYREVIMPCQFLDYRMMEPARQEEACQSFLEADKLVRFDFRNPPLMRLALMQLSDDRYKMIWTTHHLILDGWSVSILVREFFATYDAIVNGNETPHAEDKFQDYIRYIEGRDKGKEERYWRRYLTGVEAGSLLPFISTVPDRNRSTGIYQEQQLLLDESFTDTIREYVSRHNLTFNTLFQAVWAYLLHRYTGEETVMFGVVVAGRPDQLEQLERRIGLYINTLPLRSDLPNDQSIPAWLQEMQQQQARSREYQYASLTDIKKWIGIQNELFDSIVVFENYPVYEAVTSKKGNLQVDKITVSDEQDNHPLSIVISAAEKITVLFRYNSSLLQAAVIKQIRDHFEKVLAYFVQSGDTMIEHIDLLTAEERIRQLDKARGFQNGISGLLVNPFSFYVTMRQRLQGQNKGPAIKFNHLTISWEEVHKIVRQLMGQFSQGFKLQKGDRVVVLVHRSEQTIIAMLSILQSGLVYVPVDPEFPEDRIRFILNDVKPALVLTEPGLLSLATEENRRGIVLAELLAKEGSYTLQDPVINEGDEAYIIYTSGSTGQPKGTIATHGNLNYFFKHICGHYVGKHPAVMPFLASSSFDISLMQVLLPLLSGGVSIVVGREDVRDMEKLSNVVRSATMIDTVPAVYALLLQTIIEQGNIPAYDHIERVFIGGDQIPDDLLQKLPQVFRNAVITVTYGPTEGTVFCTAWSRRPEEVNGDNRGSLIGYPVEGAAIYILDEKGDLIPEGIDGEICIGGAGVTKGYLNQPALTKEKYMPDPFQDGAVLYRTGDLGRWTKEGIVEFRGRKDAQVKIGGIRIEPAEIENCIRKHPAIAEVVVLAAMDPQGEKMLAAYFVEKETGTVTPRELRQYLYKHLPHYMVPASYVRLPEMPLSLNGKIDRRQLPVPELVALSANEYVAPRNSLETRLAATWQELLQLDRVGIYDNFFELGGHSLLVTRMLAAIRKQQPASIEIRDLLTYPTIAELAGFLQQQEQADELPPLLPQPRPGYIPLSFAQERLWFIDRLQGSLQYHINEVIRIKGNVRIDALVDALKAIVGRHEILRTVLREEGGKAYQVILEQGQWQLSRLQDAGLADDPVKLEKLVAGFLKQPFDLSKDHPFRAHLIQLREKEHVLLLTVHHIASDGWSSSIIVQELLELYNSMVENRQPLLANLEIQYADYAIWQRSNFDAGLLDPALQYWTHQLASVDPLQLNTDFPRPAVFRPNGKTSWKDIDRELKNRLQHIARENNTTLFMVLLAAFKALLFRYTGQEDISIGCPVAGRQQKELEGLIGCFVNILVIRSRLHGNQSFKDLLQAVKKTTLDAYQYQDVPFERIVDALEIERDTGRNPLFDIKFALHNTPDPGKLNLPGGVELLMEQSGYNTAQIDISFDITESADGLRISMTYCADLFHNQRMEAMLRHYEQLLRAVCEMENNAIADLPVVDRQEEFQLLVAFNDTKLDYGEGNTIPAIFARQVATAPGATALVMKETRITYRELDDRSNQLAGWLVKKGIKPGALVPVCMRRSPDMIIGVLGILKAGGAYVPVDVTYPGDRIKYMLSDTAPSFILSDSHSLENIDVYGKAEVLCVDLLWEQISHLPREVPACKPSPTDLAYIIYTSGSTGKPKGVMIPHQGVVNMVNNQVRPLGLKPGIKVLQFASFSFDASCYEIFCTLLVGGQLILTEQAAILDAASLEKLLKQHEIELVTLPPGYLSAMKDRLPGLKTIVSAGEQLDRQATWQLQQQGIKVINAYGPTENTVCSTLSEDPVNEQGIVSIGRPLGNVRAYILDSQRRPVPIGVTGHLYLAGVQLAHGYWNQPHLTAEKFIDNPFDKGSIMYHTGDLARWQADGTIVFEGRMDEQVKLRGYRIELGEIIHALQNCDGILKAEVIVTTAVTAEKQLVAFIVVNNTIDEETVRSLLRISLPDYMIPAFILPVDEIPLTASGKVDRKKLEAFALQILGSRPRDGFIAPSGNPETSIAAIWQELLGLDTISATLNFFEAGGNSLLAIRVIAAIRKELGIEVGIKDMFDYPTINTLSHHISRQSGNPVLPAIAATERPRNIPLSFSQERVWFIDKLQGSLQYHLQWRFSIKGRLNREALENAFREIMNRHEVLRTVIYEIDGEPFQLVDANDNWQLQYATELDIIPAYGSVERYFDVIAATPFDLSRDRLLKVCLVRLPDDTHRLLVLLHHLVFDGWSLKLIVEELSALYHDTLEGRSALLKPLPVQYADYAIWQRTYLSGDTLARKLDYWVNQLQELEPLTLVTDYPRPSTLSIRGGQVNKFISAGLRDELMHVAQREQVTLFVVLLSVFKILLHRYSGKQDICVGTPVAGRSQQELETLIGFFVNTLALRSQVDGKMTYREFLGNLKQTTLDAYEHQDIPFEKIVEAVEVERSLSRTPVFQVMFSLQNNPEAQALQLSDLVIQQEDTDNILARFDLNLAISESAHGLQLSMIYCADLFKEGTVAAMLDHYEELISSVVADINKPIGGLNMLAAKETDRLLRQWGRSSVVYPTGKTAIDLFEEQAMASPHATALVFEEERLTYAELNRRANQLAASLLQQGLNIEEPVLVSVKRSVACIIGILGILKAGGAYVPFDEQYPDERIRYLLLDTGARFCVGNKTMEKRPVVSDLNIQVIEPKKCACGNCSCATAGTLNVNRSQAHQLAYIIYTSGSTGNPKGVMIEHFALVDHVFGLIREAELSTCNAFALFASLVADAGHAIIFSALIKGSALHVLSDEVLLSGQAIGRYVKDHAIDCIKIVPSLWLSYASGGHIPLPARVLIFGGEAFSMSILSFLKQRNYEGLVFNHYGPTEVTIGKCIYKISLSEDYTNMPIGKPFSNTRAYIVDEWLQPCPVGLAGELLLGGDGVARGYLNLPELTKDRFINDPFDTIGQPRLYRTGDLCRWLPDGVIEYLGRRDDQVKVRGYRIEPGEVARVIEQSGLVKQAAVIAAEAGDGSRQLVGYVVGTEGFSAGSVMSYLRSRLPEYMIPARLIPLDRLPLNSNGKLNRRALPSAVLVQEEGLEYVAPRNDREQTLSLIWCRLLGLSQVSVTDNFFTLGGHSLLAIRVASAIWNELQIQVAVRDLFIHPTISALAEHITGKAAEETIEDIPIGILPVPPLAPLSYSQERLWFIDQLHGSVQYHIPYVFEVHGELDVVSFERSFRTLIHRHAVLRTVIREEGGRGYQQVLEEVDWSVDHVSCRELDEQALAGCIEEQITRPFDLSVDVKLRVWLLERADSHVIVVVLHHIASDGWSLGLLVEEFTHLYNRYHSGESISLPAVSVSYRDYALWERSYVSGPRLERKLAYWKEQLRDISPLELPADYSRGRLHRIEAGVEHRFWDTGLREQLESLASRQGATLYMLLLSVFKVLLHRYTGQEVLCVGSPVAGRYRSEMEKIIGCFVNTLVLRSEVRGGMRFTELLDQVKETTLAAYEHQEVPFEKLVEVLGLERDMSRHPLYDVKFQLANLPVAEELVLAGLEVSGLRSVASRAQMDLSVDITPVASGLHVSVTYSSSLYKAARMRRLLDHYEQLLRSVIINADKTVGELALLTTTEEAQLEAFSGNKARVPLATQNVQGPQSILEVFSRQVLQIPLSIAVASGRRQLSYGALEEESNRLARYLRHKGVGPDVAVGICCGREPEMVIGILGILKAGGGYVPLDPDYPSERLSYMLSDSGSQLVLTHSACTEVLQQLSTDYELIELDGPMATYRQCSAQEIDHRVGPSDLAYVIYTSGSTGRPKGVCIEHGTLLRSTQARIAYYNITPSIFQVPSFSFDSSVAVLFWALLTGGRVLLSKTEELKDADYIGRVLQQSDTLLCVPSYYRFVLSEGLLIGAGLKQVILAGESVEPALVADHYRASAGVKLYNEYGPTEGTVWSTVCELKAGEEVITIGRPVEGVSVYLLDDSGRPAPIGISGELYIGGLQLARGYLNQPELTKEKFIDHKGERLYRTGDRGHWDQEGRIVFEGRRDDQVKLRGYRIELSEIGRLLEEHEAVQQAVALVVEAEGGHKQLMGFVACGVKEGREAEVATVSSEALRSWLLARLPEYMVPVRILTGEALPLTPNGKIDKQVLLQWSLPENTENGTGYEGPRNDFESAMVSIWSEVLGVERVGIHDNFFELGGDSIISIQVVSRARRLGYVFEVADLFSYQAISRLPVSQQAAPAQQQPAAEGIANLLPIQHWYFDQSGAGEVPFNQGVLVGLDKQIGEQELTQVLNLVLGHHDALRMRYNKMESGWQQSYQPVEAVAAHVYEEDLRGYSGEDFLNELKRLSEQYQGAPSIQRGDLVRMVLFRTGEEYTHNRLLLIIHHLVVDGVSWRILLEDMEYALEAVLEGRSVSLPAVGSSYGDWSAALSLYAKSARVQNQLAYWEGVQKAYKPVKTDHTKDNGPVTGERRSYGVRLPQQLTRRLLQESHRSYHTEINDLLLSALGRVVGDWSGLEEVLVGLEGHGRWPELVGGGVDISRTVGWFTSIYPLRLSSGTGLDTGAHIKNVKEQLRGIPDKGLGYGVLKYLEHTTSLQGREGWDIVFNYLGQSDNVVKSSRWFSGAGEDAGSGEGAGWKSEVLLSVNSIVMGGELLIRWGYNSQWYEESTIRELAEGYLLELENIIEHCGSRQEVEHTPSDYGLGKEISYAELDEFMEEREGGIKRRVLVDSLYRLSSLQEGLLFHGLYASAAGAYVDQMSCDLLSPDIASFCAVWDHLLSRHSILRSSFYHDRFRIPVQCVYRKVRIPVVELDYRDQADQPGAVSLYEYTDRMRGFVFSEGPLMRVSLLRLSEDRYRMVWTHHHLVLDGWSLPVLMEEFLRLYDQLVKGEPVPAVVEDRYEDYIRYTEQRSKEEEEAYWRGYLQGLEVGTLLPFIDLSTERNKGTGAFRAEELRIEAGLTQQIQDYAQLHRLTVNTVMQGVWSYLLYRYTGNPQVVYGVTVSGRPEDLAGVEQRVGMYINTLPLHARIEEDSDISTWLQDIQKGQINSRTYQYSSLSDMQRWIGVKGELFDTVFIYQNYPMEKIAAAKQNQLQVRDFVSRENTNNYPLTIRILEAEEIAIQFIYKEALLGESHVIKIKDHFKEVVSKLVQPAVKSIGDLYTQSDQAISIRHLDVQAQDLFDL